MSRYPAAALIDLATDLFTHSGLDPEKARVVAEILVEGDLLGHTTHGLAFVAPYLAEIEQGAMTRTGDPLVVADYPAAVTWDGRRLPGPWLTVKGFDLAIERARRNGTCTVVVRRSHHIGCLAAYLERVANQGLVALLACSDPTVASVAPHGGTTAVFTPNPIAAAWPTAGAPVIFDVSMSIATNGLTSRLRTEAKSFPGAWAIDAAGRPTDDPGVLFSNPPGALLPIGGTDHGHKGYALGLLVEALTGGLAGHGRADAKEGWTGTTFIQVLVPGLFGGEEAFRREAEAVAVACRASRPRPGFERVRLPGETGLKRKHEQLEHGIELYPSIMPSIRPWAERFGVTLPEAR